MQRRADLLQPRPPAYVSRETGAAELDISSDTWDAMVKSGQLPQPVRIGISGTTPRWRWADVDAALAARAQPALNATEEPYFRMTNHVATKDRRRGGTA